MPSANNIGDIVVLIGNSVYHYPKLPEGGTWYCSLSSINTVGISGHNPIVSSNDRAIPTYKEGGSNTGNNLVIAYRIG